MAIVLKASNILLFANSFVNFVLKATTSVSQTFLAFPHKLYAFRHSITPLARQEFQINAITIVCMRNGRFMTPAMLPASNS